MSSTTSSAPPPPPSHHPPPPTTTDGDGRTNIVGIVLGVAGLFIVCIIVYTTWRLKRRRSAGAADDPSFGDPQKHGTVLDRAHPAARITPFGSPEGETPRFKHTPGADMRIAVRRPDGAWQFSDPRTPFAPIGVSELDVLPSPSPSSFSSTATATIPPVRGPHKKELEAKPARKACERDYDPDLNPPPPAYGYGYEYGGYINHDKI
ncbi:hypothetical protein BDZ94DRAFT_790607 [Collybia nuda]|uniref:Uncharacterized protein n=1 Tax=Collybia nuda TaxID=64659 RepID=A0A9P5Y1U0_9AGAR|nr:hypothetical protein BDZ94DRAFT_790607 [Collybia nuda]